MFGKRNEKSPQSRKAGYFAQKIGTNRLISEKIVSWDFVPPFDFAAQFLASRAHRRGEHTIALTSKKSESPVWCCILKIVRTYFAAAGGEKRPPQKLEIAAEPHR